MCDNNAYKKGGKMKIIFLILNWIFGGLLLLVGIIFIFKDARIGALIMLASFFIIPSVREFIYLKTNKKISIGQRSLIVIVLVGISLGLISSIQQAEQQKVEQQKIEQQKIEQQKLNIEQQRTEDKKIKYFEENKVKILKEIDLKIQDGNYTDATSIASKYLSSKNEELIRLNEEAKKLLSKKQEELKLQAIVKEKEESLAKDAVENKNKIKKQKEQDVRLIEATIGDIKDFKKFNDYSKLSLEELNIKLQAMRFMGKVIQGIEDRAKKDKDLLPIWREAKELQIQTQTVHYPKMRNALGPLMRQTLWEHNIHVKTTGKEYERIVFTGAYFASNMNIKTTNESLSVLLHDYRFKRSDYKWLQSASEWTYYTLDTKKDSEL
jgi:hypothetical protein